MELDEKYLIIKTKNEMAKSTPAGMYSVQPNTGLAVKFSQIEIVNVETGDVLRKGRETASGKTAGHDWQTVTLETVKGDRLIVDGLKLAKQCVTDEKLRKAVYRSFDAAMANEGLVISVAEFNSSFTIGLANNKFSC